MDAYNKSSMTANDWSGLTLLNYFKERVAYDANGNILKYLRNGHKATSVMDSLTYGYNTGTNQLNWIRDQVPANTYGTVAGDVPDIDNQGANNYTYDEIGNLNSDNAEGISSIRWSVYGKILEINKVASASNPVTRMRFTYDAQGNRISKVVEKNSGINTYTWYVRDAQGNVLTTYSSSGSATTDLSTLPLQLTERHLYGSSRLGMYSQTLNVDNSPADMTDSNGTRYFRGYREYELTNHLGNVLATITDKKKPVYAGGLVSYYDADVTTAQDYYPFGMQMPGRIGYQTQGGWVSAPGSGTDNTLPADLSVSLRNNNLPPEYTASNSIELTPGFESGTGDAFNAYITAAVAGGAGSGTDGSSLNGAYRYGFNGKENDNEVKGTGNQLDYGMRIYDPRLGRFLSEDPITKKYPELTPYQFASNTPIWAIDRDGEEARVYTETKGTGHTFLTVQDGKDIIVYTYGRYAGGDLVTAGTTGPGVLIRYTGDKASSFIKSELYRMEAKAFEVKDANQGKVKQYLDDLYNSSSITPKTDDPDIKKYGRVVNTYSLFGCNCTTTSSNALKAGGTNAFEVDGFLYDYDEDFTIPSSLQNFLLGKSKSDPNIQEITEQMKMQFPNTNDKTALKSAGSSGSASGSSGNSSGSSANSSSTKSSSSGNGSASSGSGSNSSSSQDYDKP